MVSGKFSPGNFSGTKWAREVSGGNLLHPDTFSDFPEPHPSSWFLLQRHPGGTAKAVYGEATYSQVPRDGRRPSVHDLPCEASRSAKMGEGRSDRNLYAQEGARRNQGGD